MFLGRGDHSHWPFPGTQLEAAVVSGLATQKQWWEQQATGRESQEHLKASEPWLDGAESWGSAGARGSRQTAPRCSGTRKGSPRRYRA